jgi:hypothetical protein
MSLNCATHICFMTVPCLLLTPCYTSTTYEYHSSAPSRAMGHISKLLTFWT